MMIAITLVLLGILIQYLYLRFFSKNKFRFYKFGKYYFINLTRLKEKQLRYNSKKFLNTIKKIKIVEYETGFTVKKTKKNFLIFTAYSSNKKQESKMYEILVCNDIVKKYLSINNYNDLQNYEEINCLIIYKDD